VDWLPGITLTDPQRNLVELVGTAVTAVVALWAIFQAYRQGRLAMKAIKSERRLDFELDLLKELAELLRGSTFVVTVQEKVDLRLQMFKPDEFKMCRDAFGLNGPEAYQALVDSVETQAGLDILLAEMPDGQTVKTYALQEVLDAIARRLSARSTTGA
jgi:hypothetical protein